MTHEPGEVVQICLDRPTLLALAALASERGGTVETEIRQAVVSHLGNPQYPVGVASNAAATLALPVSVLELSVRGRKCLPKLGVQSLGDLAQYSPAALLECRNVGQITVDEIQRKLKEFGLSLSEDGA